MANIAELHDLLPRGTFNALLPAERQSIRPQMRVKAREWIEANRSLGGDSPMPGPMDLSFTPYVEDILDSYLDPACRDITLMGSTQWGKSETLLSALCLTIATDPQPTLFVMPNEEEVVSFGKHRLRVAFELCPPVLALRERETDWTNLEIGFRGMTLFLGYANSPARLSSRSIGRLIFDELDKMPAFSGRETSPILLAKERQRWWPGSKTLGASTPRTQRDNVWPAFAASDQRWFYVPCPKCKEYQPLRFGQDTVIFPKEVRSPDEIASKRLASYVCVHCKFEIPDETGIKRVMLSRGRWCPEGGRVTRDGEIKGVSLDAERRGYHLNALYSPMLSWSDVAAMFLRSKDDWSRLWHFTNSWLGWPWVERVKNVVEDDLLRRQIDVPRGIVPDNTLLLTMGCDVQKHEIYWVVRAWASAERSHTVDYGRCYALEDIVRVMRKGFPDRQGNAVDVRLAFIDSGYRTDEVYGLAIDYPHMIRAVKGQEGGQATPLRMVRIERDWLGKPAGIQLTHVDTEYFKDKNARHLLASIGETGAWTFHREVQREYIEHMLSEEKAIDRDRSKRTAREAWVKRIGGGANHWWDCETYAAAAAEMLGVHRFRDDSGPMGPQPYDDSPEPPSGGGGFVRRSEGFVRRRGDGEGFVRRK